ncbi:MAG: site-specific integrase [Actinobacteria bacterium]|nr:site-specific integrase [Actinomycetota bacterium]
MTLVAPTLQAFFTTRLTSQFGASPHTVAAYRDTWRLLLTYLADTTGTPPQALDLSALTAEVISEFLTHLEAVRGNAVTTRNARLAAIHSFFGYAAYRHPEHAATISQVMAIPAKRHHRTDLTYLTPPEVTALLAAPDQTTAAGRRDHALLQVAVTAGLRVSELTGLTLSDLHLGTAAHVVCRGKGRKNRITPLDAQTVAVLRAYTTTRSLVTGIVFPTRAGTRMSRDAVATRLTQHTATARTTCPTLTNKTVTPHTLRHTAAMRLLAAGIDSMVIALWLGHERIDTTQIYLHADMKIKEAAMDRTTPTGTQPGRYKPADDTLLAFLQSL